MWLNDIKPKGGMLDGLRAGRRNLDGSEYFFPNKPKNTKTEGVLHKNAGRFLLYSGIEKYEQMFYYNFTTTHDGTIWELLKIVRIWYII